MKRALMSSGALIAAVLLTLAPGPARCEDQIVEHTVRSGDNLHLIAGYYYGDPRQWKRIWKSNRTTLPSANLLVPGRVLRVEGSPDDNLLGSYEDFRSRVRGK